jgi:transposase
MKRFIEGTDRGQSTLLPDCLDDWIDDDNPVRAVDVFVDGLDLNELGFGGVVPETTGRPSYHPSALLKLYIYGYLNRVQSSRRLEREAGRNLEVIWLLRQLTPDDKTIADFRKDNGPAIKKVCAVRRAVSADGPAQRGERGHRRQQVQSGQHPRQELHAREGRAAAHAARGKRCPLSGPARHGRSAGALGSSSGEDTASEGEAG